MPDPYQTSHANLHRLLQLIVLKRFIHTVFLLTQQWADSPDALALPPVPCKNRSNQPWRSAQTVRPDRFNLHHKTATPRAAPLPEARR